MTLTIRLEPEPVIEGTAEELAELAGTLELAADVGEAAGHFLSDAGVERLTVIVKR